MPDARDETRLLLRRSAAGDASALERLLPVVYDQLRALAGRQLAGAECAEVDPTALVHEAMLKMLGSDGLSVADRSHFFAIAARAMRQALVDEHRKLASAKRGGGWRRLGVLDTLAATPDPSVDVERLAGALDRLAALDERAHRIVELRFFGGMTNDEVARALGIGRTTVAKDWQHARAWLRRELEGQGADG